MSSAMAKARSSVSARRGTVPAPRALLLFCAVASAYLPESAGAHRGAVRAPAGTVPAAVDQIMKDVQSITYPPDAYWRYVQATVPQAEPFPCEEGRGRVPWRSPSPPESVHQLRPGDIDVVGAMGDSLVCGNGAREYSPLGMAIQDRGVSYSGGGISTWRQIVTLPNILKVFNPNLVGYSKGRGDFLSYNAQLNVAIPAAIDDDSLDQAKLFVYKMQRDPAVNFTHDWKLLSISIGHNDLCSYQCFYKKQNTPEAHKLQLQKALDYLYKKVPRLFVSVVSMLDTTMTARMPRSNFCQLLNRIACPCVFQEATLEKGIVEMTRIVQKYQQKELELALSRRYMGRKDFTVEWQPFLQSTNLYKYSKEMEDDNTLFKMLARTPIMTPDCVHFNQRGMAILSTLLWRNMLEPVGNKTRRFLLATHRDIKCPTREAPYLFTKKNSENYYKFGHQ
ncbi:phospholipase B1, membrane-associated-like [Hetaerina americana]|uniref:phospholipase B1, membrane-associated-like n=1 Tax=Hetaerina americana TaxID=62018 RepID=UPI003A7F4E37